MKVLVSITIDGEFGDIIVYDFLSEKQATKLEKRWKKYASKNSHSCEFLATSADGGKYCSTSSDETDLFEPEGGCCGQSRCFICGDVFSQVSEIIFRPVSIEEKKVLESMLSFDCSLQGQVFKRLTEE